MDLAEFEERYGKVVNGKTISGRTITGVFYTNGFISVYGDLVPHAEGVYELPANLRIDGNLNLAGTSVKVLNPNLTVSGTLTLTDSQVETIPDNVVAGNFIGKNSRLLSIGNNLTVNGDLDLRRSDIAYIGPHLRVTGTLSLCDTKIKKLSEDVEVGALNLNNSELEALPEKLTVASSLVLTGTKVKEIGDYTTIKGTFDLTNTQINELPYELCVGVEFEGVYDSVTLFPLCYEHEPRDILILKDTSITTLPDYFYAECLDLSDSSVESYGEWAEVEKLILTKGLRGIPGGNLDVCYIDVIGGSLEAIESAFKLKPRYKILISGQAPGLPENLDYDCELVLKDAVFETFPSHAFAWRIKLIDTKVPLIPSGFRAGDISIYGKKSNCLFDDYFKCTELKIRNTSVSKLPERMEFKRLIVIDSPVEALPDNLHCPGAIYLDTTNITKLPENLEIDYLQIIGPRSKIAMPESLVIINNFLLWEDFPYETWPDNLLVFDSIQIPNNKLPSLPIEELTRHAFQKEVKGDLIYWKNGRFVTYPGMGNFEIIERESKKIKLRKICTDKGFWVEKGKDTKWDKLFEYMY